MTTHTQTLSMQKRLSESTLPERAFHLFTKPAHTCIQASHARLPDCTLPGRAARCCPAIVWPWPERAAVNWQKHSLCWHRRWCGKWSGDSCTQKHIGKWMKAHVHTRKHTYFLYMCTMNVPVKVCKYTGPHSSMHIICLLLIWTLLVVFTSTYVHVCCYLVFLSSLSISQHQNHHHQYHHHHHQ